MKKQTLRILSILLSAILLLTALPVASFAADGDTVSGTCGDNLTWVLDTDSVLTISGTGSMTNWSSDFDAPWYGYENDIKTVDITTGVTSIGDHAFFDCSSLTNITIPDGITSIGTEAFLLCIILTNIKIPNSFTSIGDHAFHRCSSLTSITIPDGVTSIGECAFYDCSSLKSIMIPDSVISIGGLAFGYDYDSDLDDDTPIPGFTIYGKIGSAAQAYAEENGLAFVEHTDSGATCSHTNTYVTGYVAPTCTEDGYTGDTYCCDCHEKLADGEKIDKTAHRFGEWFELMPATVVNNGVEKRICSDCTASEEREILMLAAKIATDDENQIAVLYTDEEFDCDITVNATEKLDGAAYKLLNEEFGSLNKILYDITVYSDGNKVQPNGTVWVRVKIPEGYHAEYMAVYYIADSDTIKEVQFIVRDEYVYFAAEHFSDYAIVDTFTTVTPACSCLCHKSGIVNFFWKIINFLHKLFGMEKYHYCACGEKHW